MIIRTATDAAELFGPCFREMDGAAAAVAHLDHDRRLIKLLVLPSDLQEHAQIPVRRIVEDALRLGAEGLVIAHNHTDGDARPAGDDVEATRELADTAARLGIRLHDHLIFAGDDMVSLRALGLL